MDLSTKINYKQIEQSLNVIIKACQEPLLIVGIKEN